MNKAIIAVSLLAASAQVNLAMAYDSGPQTLGSTAGATDYYHIGCPANDGLGFQIEDTTLLAPAEPRLTLQVFKGGLSAEAADIASGRASQLMLPGRNGKYRVTVLASGQPRTAKQTYLLEFACWNADNRPTRSSRKAATAKLRNTGTAKYSVKCSTDRANGATDKLSAKLSNTTQTGKILMAQIVSGRMAVTTTDGNAVSIGAGAPGDYYLTVDNTGTDPGQDISKQYSFAARCLDASGGAAAEPVVERLQDQ